jgi:uncharacterized protein with PIN domain
MTVRLCFPDALTFFLQRRHRDGRIDHAYDGTSSLGHVVQSFGVPLTEVGAMVVDDREVAPSYQPCSGDVVTVSARERPQGLTEPARFLLDVHLGALARRMRLVGLDAAYRNDAEDAELLTEANREGRVLLTQDRGLLKRRALHHGAYVRGARPDDQLSDVLERFAVPLAPFTRCMACNGRLVGVAKSAVEDLLEPGTRRSYDDFSRCTSCRRVFWRGAHASRLEGLAYRPLQAVDRIASRGERRCKDGTCSLDAMSGGSRG